MSAVSKPRKAKYVPCPGTPITQRGGCKVSWNTYATKPEADAAAKWAVKEANRKSALGYDFGYQSPGTITKVKNGYEVVMP